MFIFAPILNVSCPGLMGFTTIFPHLACVPTFICCPNTSNPKPRVGVLEDRCPLAASYLELILARSDLQGPLESTARGPAAGSCPWVLCATPDSIAFSGPFTRSSLWPEA